MITLNRSFTAEDGHLIELELEVSISNDGIGAYQYGSQSCVDHGTDYMSDCEVSLISGGDAGHNYVKEAKDWVDENWDDIAKDAFNEIASDIADAKISARE